jgi:GTPase SAR1 family protein
MKTPCFAVLGDVNPGKSAVVAALAQDSSAGISPTPGETSEARRFSYRGMFDVWDTPGFQRPLKMLREVQEARAHPDPLSVYRDFVERNTDNEQFQTERELLKPILEQGAALIYVVDPSRTFSKLHEAETEILKMTARPLIVVFNATKTPDPENERRWNNHVKQHFGQAPIEFNAHQVTASDRAELIREFAKKCEGWGEAYLDWVEPLTEAADSIERDFEQDLGNAAAIVVELLSSAVGYRAESFAPVTATKAEREDQKKKLVATYKEMVQRIEARSHQRLIENFGHQDWITSDVGAPEFYQETLFDAETAQVLGLSLRTLALTGAAAGALVGGKIDALVGGATFLAGAAIGAVVGGGGAYFGGKRAMEPMMKVEKGSEMRPFHAVTDNLFATGTRVVVGPVRSDNFVFILLDRAVGLIGELLRRTHARRDQQRLTAAALKESLDRANAATESWPDALRKSCLAFARKARDGKSTRGLDFDLQEHLATHLRKLFMME